MIHSGLWDQRPYTLSLKANCITISLSTSGRDEVISFDHEGRLWAAMLEGISYRRGLDGKVVAKWSRDGQSHRRWLSPIEARSLEESTRSLAAGLVKALQSGEASVQPSIPASDLPTLAATTIFDPHRSALDISMYHQVYKPVGILPPDQYMAVVLQATEGCSFNTCTFCSFYKERPFRVKNPQQFLQHAQAVKDFLGKGLSLRRTLFLGDANALVLPMTKLVPLIECAHQIFDVARLGGIYAFLDGFSAEKKQPGDYARLASLGLTRVYLGVESGSPGLLEFLKKPGRPEDTLAAVKAIKAGGVAMGVIILLGAGGRQYANAHVRDTIRLLNKMPLDADDLLYFSELVEDEDLPYTRDAYRADLQPLSESGRISQQEQIESRLRFSTSGGTPHISRYDIREFVY